ncbi:B box and SPRY domain-containing protein isoform X1 [Clupea harengus]|uniref:B box and SPRY domain-containing protein isoform X1 n=2 Tax=Clupea harengus TaxID=7950 RepID=A0A6P8G0A0_CLUHA|nr:B box and SPRY domain-containing protein isoform X1 [Clupea harengus]
MTEDRGICDLAVVSLQDSEPEAEMEDGESHAYHRGEKDSKQPEGTTKHPFNGGMDNVNVSGHSVTLTSTNNPKSEIEPSTLKTCVDHDSELDSFCSSEGKLICSLCAISGPCQGHTVTALATQATAVRNQLVDSCEKMQLQASRIERFISQTLSAKEKAVQADASAARERVLAQVNAVREALDEEEQRLLEAVQKEQERVEQCLLTQRAHWSQALTTLAHTRTNLVHTLTHSQDAQLVTSSQEISDRLEEAEGVGEPRDTEQLNLSSDCSDSRLMQGLWASAVLLGPSAHGPANLRFQERSISSMLSLSTDECTLTFLPKRARQSPPYDPARFDCWPNALGTLAISSGTHSWVLDVGQSDAYKVGVCYASMDRKGSGNGARLGYNDRSWVLSHYEGDFTFCHAGRHVALHLIQRPKHVGMLVDWPSQTLVFYDPDSYCVLHAISHPFSAPLLPACAVADHSVTLLH